MLIGTKDLLKNAAISVVTCCAVFVCTLFLSYNLDLAGIKDLLTPQSTVIYDALLSTGKVVCAVTGGCLALTTLIMLIFYIKNYIDVHGKELGILKALGHSRISVASRFSVFGWGVFAGTALGFGAAYIYMPTFYELQNADGLLPEITIGSHPWLIFALVLLPTVFFALLSVLYAFFRMKTPVMHLIKGAVKTKQRSGKKEKSNLSYLTGLKRSIFKSKKMSVFFVGFSAFCFSSMTQMSMSMHTLASDGFAWIMITIGLILAFMTLLMSLTSVVHASAQTVAMMKAFGYTDRECSGSVLGNYKYIALIGFAVGTVYQYALLRIMVDVVFSEYENMPEYNFDFEAMLISFALFLVAYLLILAVYSKIITRRSLKSIMLD